MRSKERKQSISSEDGELAAGVVSIKFQCECETIFGETLYICGNIEELGNWNPENAVKMITEKSIYPLWECSTELTCPVGMSIEYKYLIKTDSGNVQWEVIPNHERRIVTMKKSGIFIILNKKNDISIKVRQIEDNDFNEQKPCQDFDENFNNDFNPNNFVRPKKYSFESNNSLIITSEEPVELLSYENNKMISDILTESLDFTLNQKISSNDRIIMATYYLPIEIFRTNKGFDYKQRTDSSFYATLNNIKMEKKANLIWVGMLKDYFSYTEDEINEIDYMLQESDYYMIFPEKEDWDNYNFYLNKLMFPILKENCYENNNDYIYETEKYFQGYHRINQEYGKIIGMNMSIHDMIIINDISLALIPNTLIQKNNNASIGMYFHSPLPCSDMIKALPKYQEIIQSVLLCDVIGFHLNVTLRNFLNVLQRFFGVFYEITKKGIMCLKYLGRTIVLYLKQGQVDLNYLKELTNEDQFIQEEKKFDEIIQKRLACISLDHLNLIIPLANKLIAIDNFFEENKNAINEVIFVLYVKYLDKENSKNYKYVTDKVDKIKKKYNNDKIIHIEFNQSFNIYKRLASFKKSNFLLYNFYFEGNVIYANEFLALQNGDKKYYLVLEERASGLFKTSATLITSNPYNANSIKNVLTKCYREQLTKGELEQRYEKDYALLKDNSTLKWVRLFLLDLKRVKFHDSTNKSSVSMGLTFKLQKFNQKFSHLEQKQLIKYYQRAKSRLFFLNYETSLIENSSSENKMTLDIKRLLNILKYLAKDNKNLIFILSKHETDHMMEVFGPMSNLIGLCCENGFFYKYPNEDDFSQITPVTDFSWFDPVIKILNVFTEKTEGSYIERKKSSISWVNKNYNNYFGRIQANDLKTHLLSILGNKIDVVIEGENVDIKPKNVNKAAFIAKILQKEIRSKQIDFIFCVGEDNSDNETFKYLKSAEKYFVNFNQRIKLITTNIGKNPSDAKYYFNEVNECIEDLEVLGHLENDFRRKTLNNDNLSNLDQLKRRTYIRTLSQKFPNLFIKGITSKENNGNDNNNPESKF